ncbi:tyrosine-type recombinase/integrase [Bacillus cereus]|uniref:tyrosine-type recombinase/integrase n=1 Tax=Bacillus cereus TaxID=1396 RepID=UPI00397FB679
MKLQEVLAKVEKVFEIADEKRLARVNEKGVAFKENHQKSYYEDYKLAANRVIESIIKEVNPLLGRTQAKYNNPLFYNKEVIDKWLELRCEDVAKGELAIKSLKKEVHAMDALRQFSNNKEVDIFSGHKKIKIGGYEEHSNRIKYVNEELGSVSYKDSRYAKISVDEARKVMDHLRGPYSEWVKDVLDTILQTGARHSTVLKMEAGHIRPDKGYVRLESQKGGKKANVLQTPAQMSAMREKKEMFKKTGSLIHGMKDKKGDEISIQKKMQIVDRYVRKAAVRAGIEMPSGKGVTVHSFRKAWGQSIYDSTRSWNRDKVWKEINQYISLQGNNAKETKKRIDREWKRINRINIERGRSTREFKLEELRTLYSSLMLSHSRIDVSRHYINRDIKQHQKNAR